MVLSLDIVKRTIEAGIAEGLRRNFFVAVAVVDASGRPLGLLKHEKAIWAGPDLALRKATFASAFRRDTIETFTRYQNEVPTFGVAISALSGANDWFIGPGGVGIWSGSGDHKTLLGCVGVSGAAPYQEDHEISAAAANWCAAQLAN